MNTRERRTKQEYALLLCGEFFRDELQFCQVTIRQQEKMEQLRTLVYDALGDPSMADAEAIKSRYAKLKEGTSNGN